MNNSYQDALTDGVRRVIEIAEEQNGGLNNFEIENKNKRRYTKMKMAEKKIVDTLQVYLDDAKFYFDNNEIEWYVEAMDRFFGAARFVKDICGDEISWIDNEEEDRWEVVINQ